MNIFVLSENPDLAAESHCDKHVVKMLLESAQLMCTVAHQYGNDNTEYKPTHANHPCTKWLAESAGNWLWLQRLAAGLNREYRFRFRKRCDHKSWGVIVRTPMPSNMPQVFRTPYAQAMPVQYKHGNAVQAYRDYYFAEKRDIAVWSRRGAPQWWYDRIVREQAA